MLLRWIPYVFNLIVPPRRTEKIVESLAREQLQALMHEGMLPYHAKEVGALIWELKYYGSRKAAALAADLLRDELLSIASEELGRPLLIPVPMHWGRLSERGHNHTELLCEALMERVGNAYEYLPRGLTRTKLTEEQQKLDRARRLTNVARSMRAMDEREIRGRVCVVVDDVRTTGATLEEAERALKAAGARRVHTVALAQS